jgi:hypothetical protein
LFGGCLPTSALIALAFTLVVPDQTLFIPAILAGILAVVLMAPGAVPDLFPPAFTFVLAKHTDLLMLKRTAARIWSDLDICAVKRLVIFRLYCSSKFDLLNKAPGKTDE